MPESPASLAVQAGARALHEAGGCGLPGECGRTAYSEPEARSILHAVVTDPAVREALEAALHGSVLPGCTHDGHGSDCEVVVAAVLSALDPSPGEGER